ncbi:class I SAM-dependent methyltransferase [Helicobacter japonicus]|uniref:class I SAM-dependent methyltransferase n=1 Tax=Helicobacter japonicus TaxID=425400 RepID=UPI0025B7624F|nr:methyltransferase domain-containing protein [Helicobacter japonicus]
MSNNTFKMLNFACGSRIHPDWVNIDFSPIDNRVKKVNLLSTLPFKNDSFDVAYSSHFLEHLHPNKAVQILKEIKRILKPNGIVRIVVPDLQNMVQVYLDTLKKIESYMQNNMLDSSKKSMGGGIMKLMLPSLHNMIGLCLKYSTKWLEYKVAAI